MSKTRKNYNRDINRAFPPVQAQVLRELAPGEMTVKPATTQRASNATLSADPDLVVDILADVPYLIEAFLPITTGATPGFKFDFAGGTLGTSQTTYFLGIGVLKTANEAASAATDITAVNTAVNPTAAAHTRGYARVTAKFSASGTLALRWAQNTSNVTAAQLLNGATLSATPLDLLTGK